MLPARAAIGRPSVLAPGLLRLWILGLVLAACSQPETQADPSAAPASGVVPATAPPTIPAQDPAPAMADPTPAPVQKQPHHELATVANGCFWCSEAVLERLDGVVDVVSGYIGGTVENPNYDQVCSGTTGHAEAVQITFDPARISYDQLLVWFFKSHDPTTLDRQGPDTGTQYRSAIFFHSEAQRAAAVAAIAKAQPNFVDPIVTEVTKASRFWPAEEYHQDYYRNNPTKGYCRVMITPKLEKLGLQLKKK